MNESTVGEGKQIGQCIVSVRWEWGRSSIKFFGTSKGCKFPVHEVSAGCPLLKEDNERAGATAKNGEEHRPTRMINM